VLVIRQAETAIDAPAIHTHPRHQISELGVFIAFDLPGIRCTAPVDGGGEGHE
jgi:hypothetical protein